MNEHQHKPLQRFEKLSQLGQSLNSISHERDLHHISLSKRLRFSVRSHFGNKARKKHRASHLHTRHMTLTFMTFAWLWPFSGICERCLSA